MHNAAPLTPEEHFELGQEIRSMNARLRELADLMVSLYGRNNRAAFEFHKAVEAIDRLRNDMQSQAIEDHPGYDLTGAYR